jgi:hypothetical protein
MNINGTARGGRLCSSVNCRRVPARMSRSHHQMSSVRFGRWIHGLPPLRVTGSEYAQLPLVHAVATVKIDRGPQCKNTKPGCNRKIQSQTRAVNGIAALVTTPLRSLVTRAPSEQASHAPGIRLSHRLHSETRTAFAQSKSDFGVSAMANMWAWRAATEIQLVT